MAGCIQFLKDEGYNVFEFQRVQTYTKLNEDIVPTEVVLNRTVVHGRKGTGWEDYLGRFTDDAPRIRKLKIQLEKLRDHNDRCWGYE